MSDVQCSDAALTARAERAGVLLADRGLKLATAESCTGGWIAKVVTDVAGSSDWFEAGDVTYSNRAKVESLGVPAATLDAHGAVSEAVARAMAQGTARRHACDAAVAVSGIAGPTGGSADKPVGLVCFAWIVGDAAASATERFGGGREDVRRQAVARALDGLVAMLEPS